jgi:hypothetical protein
MATTSATDEKHRDREQITDCDNDWCDGPDGEALPCFACFDSDRTYATEPDT